MNALAPIRPVLLSEPDAARYLGISKTKLRSLGIKRKVLGGRLLYPTNDLDEFAERLPYEGQATGDDTCDADQAFG